MSAIAASRSCGGGLTAMVACERIHLDTEGFGQILDITVQVSSCVRQSAMRAGIATVFVPGATGAVTTLEYEPGLIDDMTKLFERLVPADASYEHNKRWGDGNGFSHVRASLLGPSLTVPFEDGRLLLGTWQQIVFIDFDNRPRRGRQLVVQMIGE
ncbi:MAG: secondary thiamine-phosphate synthase enzyme YjbQ [Planctomycetota bacterium]